MRYRTKTLLALAVLAAVAAGPARAEETAPATPPAATDAQSDDAQPAEVKLTEETLKSVIDATKEMQALDPGDQSASDESANTTELDAQMDAVAKKHGFTDAEAYGAAYESAVQAFAVIDWTSEARKKEAADEIAAINADTTMTAEAKAEAVKGVEEELSAPAPAALPENVELIRKHEAEMRELMSSDIGP